MLDKSQGSNRGKRIKENYEIWLKYASRHCQYGNQEITLEKHMHHFQCQQSEFKCKKCPIQVIRISNVIIGISHSFMHAPWQSKLFDSVL